MIFHLHTPSRSPTKDLHGMQTAFSTAVCATLCVLIFLWLTSCQTHHPSPNEEDSTLSTVSPLTKPCTEVPTDTPPETSVDINTETSPASSFETTGDIIGEVRDVTIRTDDVTKDIRFAPLSLGQVQAKAWLKHQLLMQAQEMTSIFESISPDCKSEGSDRSGWLGGSGESWERGTYFTRGLVTTAYVLDDDELKQQAQKWIDWTLSSQSESGAFGPYASTPDKVDYWPLMPMLMALEFYHDATGDERVIPFLEKYFAWQATSLKTRPLSDWGEARGGDNIFAVMWLYEKTGNQDLLDLCQLLYQQTYPWASVYDQDAWHTSYHIVNVQESFKLLPIMYALTGDKAYLDTYYTGIENIYMTSGRQDGMSNGDELTRGIYATYGSETCAVVERMLCDEIALYLLRDATVADHLENIAYNAFPQQLLPDGRGQVYFTMQNQISATLGMHGFTSDGGDRSVYGMPGGFPCCVHNYQMGWPLFIASMWMTTSDSGLAAGAYGPCAVTAMVGDGTHVTLTETTNYPYESTISLRITADRTDTYPLYLRVPQWCTGQVVVKVNGHTVACAPAGGTYFSLSAEWHDGDVITLEFPMEISLVVTENNSLSVRYGAVLMALEVEEKWRPLRYNPLNWTLPKGYTSYNISTEAQWNYALSNPDLEHPENSFRLVRASVAEDMQYSLAYVPFALEAKAQLVKDWGMNTAQKVAGVLPLSPVSADRLQAEEVTVRLVPFAFTRLRITMIPWSSTVQHTAHVTDGVYQNLPDDTQKHASALLFSSVPGVHVDSAAEHQQILHLRYTAPEDMEVELIINRQHCGTLLLHKGSDTLEIRHAAFRDDYHNRIQICSSNGTALPAELSVSLFVTAENLGYVRYEAESAVLSGALYNAGDHVAGIDKTGDKMTFQSVVAERSGDCTIRFYFAAPLGRATHSLYVDGQKAATIVYNEDGHSLGWGSFSSDIYAEVTIPLSQGKHKFEIVRTADDSGFAELDAFVLIFD